MQVDKEIPIPKPATGNKAKYPWETMEIGDSFLSVTRTMRSIASSAGKRYGKKFVVRKCPEGFRIWRVA